jgi:2-polyprenyl-3-methyl-5-hydroxy-6-metoxy-1,4-benzoquinol methylase
MKTVVPADDWQSSWLSSYRYDRLEIYGDLHHRGYAYAYDARRRETLRLVQEGVPVGSSVLDVAAAQGNLSLALAELGYRVTWNDLRAELVEYVKLKYDHGSINYAPGNAFELTFPDRFDAVVATEVLEHVAHPEEFLSRLRALVRVGGCIIVTTPNGAYFRNKLPRLSEILDRRGLESRQFQPDADGHLFLLHAEELMSMARTARLEVETLVLFTNSLTAGHVKLEPLLRVVPHSAVAAIEHLTRRAPRAIARKLSTQLGARLRVPHA